MFTDFPDFMSVNDIRRALCIGRTKAYELIKSGEIKSVKVGNAIRIPKVSLLDYVEDNIYNRSEAVKRRYDEGDIQ